MFLRSLTLKGFKSFAEPTTIELEPGVTAVVGPNGSGKSNVVDAVAWVLGAQGPRTMRSGRMDDVIFAGNSRRQPLGRAEVSLTIDNSAGLLPIEFREVTLTRTLFRASGESEYAINGVSCRLLDVQELMSDTGVGRQQHVIVSQGQLDAVLDARPEDRRLIIEEAAGILKYRRRKEKAERRLAATEANLVRLTDLAREVGRQLRPLERQAEAARRYGALATETRQLRLHLAGREIAALGARRAAAAEAGATLQAEQACVEAELGGLDEQVAAAERALVAAGRSPVGPAIARLEALRERARGLVAILSERERSVERDRAGRQAALEAGERAAIDAEDGRLAEARLQVDAAHAALAGRFEELACEEREVVDADAGGIAAGGGSAVRATPTASASRAFEETARARGELRASESGMARARAEVDRATSRLSVLADRRTRAEAAVREAAERLRRATTDEHALAVEIDRATQADVAADEARSAAEAALASAAAAHQSATARVEALVLVDEGAGGTADREVPAGPGVLGILASLVVVDAGWELAAESVLADAGAMVVADGVASARALLGRPVGTTPAPTVLAAGVARRTLPVAGGGAPLRARVRSARPDLAAVVEPLLDTLLAGVTVVDGGWERALDAYLADPAGVVVTKDGDRFSARGWRVGGRGPQAARRALAEAEDRASRADRERRAAEERWRTLAATAVEAKAHLGSLVARRSEVSRRLAGAEAAGARAETEARSATTELETARGRRDELTRATAADAAEIGALRELLERLEAQEADVRRREELEEEVRREHRRRLEVLRARRAALDAESAALAERGRSLDGQREALGRRREVVAEAARLAGERLGELEVLAGRLAHLAAYAADRLVAVDTALTDLRDRRRSEEEAAQGVTLHLGGLRQERHALEQRIEGLRERQRRAELEEAEASIRVESAVETLRRDLDCEPSVAAEVECPPLPDGATAASRLRDLERELRLLGPINPLAVEELTALQERSAFLAAQLGDVKSSRRELSKVIRAVEESMLDLLRAACADVAEHFEQLFETLFPGGKGRLRLTDPDRLLETGIEMEARPAGKNVRRLSLLSGGERSLCALAFLFAVFRSRPSPFYLLDEVEAALDDVNLSRFLDLVAEFRSEAQLLIVTHQKRTMEAADCLHGVTMAPGGSTKVVSERLRGPAAAPMEATAIS